MAVRKTQPTSEDIKWMRRAVELAKQCDTEPGRANPPPKVGAVAVSADGAFLAEAHRGSLGPGDHAEYCLIKQLGERSGALEGSTVYTTLEPCTERASPKIPCADRLIDEGVALVYIGMLDPDPRIRELGWRALGDAGIERRDFTAELREEVQELNRPFRESFQVAVGPRGEITFDYMQNNGTMIITHDSINFRTRWTKAGRGAIYAYASHGNLALPKSAHEFDEIDDPGLFEFAGHAKLVRNGQIVIFKNAHGFALVRVESVLAGPERGDNHTAATVSYELRLADP